MSGAQAAASDLLRARSDASEDTEEIDEGLLDAARAVFSAFETFYKARRTYQEGHPAVDRFYATLDDKLRAGLGRFGDIEVTVAPRALEIAGRAVYEVDRPDLNMWFPLYRDGIRELSLSDGLDRAEVSRFCGALALLASLKPGEEDDEGEDDAVTLLWDLALEHIGYVAIDTFVDANAADAETKARVERIREIVTVSMMKELVMPPGMDSAGRDLEVARRLKSVALSKADLRVFEAENLTALDELPPGLKESRGDLYSLDERDRTALTRGLGTDSEVDDKLLESIVHALVFGERRDLVEPLALRIERAFTALVTSGAFVRAAAMRRRVIAAAGNRTDRELFARIDQAMTADAAVNALVDALAQRSDDEVGPAIELVQVMPPAAARTLLVTLGKVEQRRRRRWICDIVASWGPQVIEATTAAIAGSSEEVALDLLYLLRVIGSDVAAAALERATHHAAASIRAGALRMYAEVARGAVAPRVRTAMRDPDPLVRAAALEIAVAFRFDHALAWIKEAIAAAGFADLDLGEKKRLFVAYATAGGDAVGADLVARLEQRNLLQRSSIDEERAAAASALGHLRYQAARGELERLATAKMLRAIVKTACAEALADLDKPPPPRPQPPSERVAPPTVPPPIATMRTMQTEHEVAMPTLPSQPTVMFKGAPRPAQPQPQPTARPQPQPQPTARPQPQPAARPQPQAQPQPQPIARPQPQAQPQPQQAARPQPQPQPAARPQPDPSARPLPHPAATVQGVEPARPAAGRRDPRSAGGVRPIDDGVAVPSRRDPRSAGGVRSADEGVAIPPRKDPKSDG